METKIVWLDKSLQYAYLREAVMRTRYPKKWVTPCVCMERLIGYAEVARVSGQKVYERRFWYLTAWDRDIEPTGPYQDRAPYEAVVQSSIEINRASTKFSGR